MLLIHPGFHKTGTTYLQQSVFSDESIFNKMGDQTFIANAIEREHPFFFDADEARRTFEANFPVSKSKINVISSETLCGNPFFGSRDAAENAERISKVYPEAKIIFTIREQVACAKSLYKQYIKMGGGAGPERFFKPKNYPQFYGFHPLTLDFGLLIARYAALFDGGVLVLPQELLQHDPQAFYSHLGEFLGRDLSSFRPLKGIDSASPVASQLRTFRLANLFMDTPINPDFKIRSRMIGRAIRYLALHIRLGGRAREDEIARAFRTAWEYDYSRGNAIAQRFCPVPIARYGYDVHAA